MKAENPNNIRQTQSEPRKSYKKNKNKKNLRTSSLKKSARRKENTHNQI